MSLRTLKQPKSSRILQRVRALDDRELSQLIAALRFSTKLEQSTLAKALQEQRRRRKQQQKEPAAL